MLIDPLCQREKLKSENHHLRQQLESFLQED